MVGPDVAPVLTSGDDVPEWASRCLNCRALLTGRFCANCGQRAVPPHPTARELAGDAIAELSGWEVNPAPMLTNTCYSFTDARNVIHVASVHEYVAAEKTFKTVAGSGGVSPGPTELEGNYAWNWARTIWADALA